MRVVLYALCVHIIIHTTFAATICSCLYFCYFYFCVYLHVQVQAVSKWGSSLTGVGTYGEWANVTVYPDFARGVSVPAILLLKLKINFVLCLCLCMSVCGCVWMCVQALS